MGDTFWDLVARAGAEHPDRVLLADDFGRELTAAGLVAAAEVAAAGLHDLGVGPGDVGVVGAAHRARGAGADRRAGPPRRGAEPDHPAAAPP